MSKTNLQEYDRKKWSKDRIKAEMDYLSRELTLTRIGIIICTAVGTLSFLFAMKSGDTSLWIASIILICFAVGLIIYYHYAIYNPYYELKKLL
ncbi:MAG: hypothetical protein AABX04_05980 [Nanoarchaeota archaeon]